MCDCSWLFQVRDTHPIRSGRKSSCSKKSTILSKFSRINLCVKQTGKSHSKNEYEDLFYPRETSEVKNKFGNYRILLVYNSQDGLPPQLWIKWKTNGRKVEITGYPNVKKNRIVQFMQFINHSNCRLRKKTYYIAKQKYIPPQMLSSIQDVGIFYFLTLYLSWQEK